MTPKPLRPSDLVARWHPGARVTMHTNALTDLSSANAVAWFDDERIASMAIASLRSDDDAARFAVVVFRPTPHVSAVDRVERINALLDAPTLRRHLATVASMWALSFVVVGAISLDGRHSIAVATTVSFLIGAFGAAPIARAWRETAGGSPSTPRRTPAPRRRLTMVTVLTDDLASAHAALEQLWSIATMCAVVDDHGRLC